MRATTLAILLSLPTASAAVAQSSLPAEITVRDMVNLPQQTPELTLQATDVMRGVRVVVREGRRAIVTRRVARLGRGGSRVIGWRAEPGVHHYVVEVSGRPSSGGTASVSVEATVTVMRPLEILVERQRINLESRVMQVRINNPASHAHLEIRDAGGGTMLSADTDLTGRPGGSPLEIHWPRLPRPIARMELRVYDVSDSWIDYEIVPFLVDIPHVDVVFESGSWEIQPSQHGHLDEAYDRILAAIAEHGADLMARLYVLGHTDTVGNNEANMELSRRRALAIARYFRARGGVAIPIMARGFGETQLVVPTADSIDEARNRRAQYILAAEAPAAGSWTRVD